MRVDWHGDQFLAQMRAEMRRRTSAAAIRLAARVKAEISQSGGHNRRGRGKLRNFTHSAPGNPPYLQTGHLRRSIAWELVPAGATSIGRVGTNLKYGRYLELGSRRMKARPYLRMALRKYGRELEQILTARIGPGGLGAIAAVQNRSGVLGSNFSRRWAGF